MPKDKKIYTIIDEYDHFANELLSFDFDNFKNMLSKNGYVRKFYEVLKKGTLGVIAQIFITGVSPITLDSITSGFNISTNLTNDPRLNDMLGFTSKDMEYLISLVDCIKNPEDILTKMKQYYDGYLFSKNGVNHMFNPNMTLYYLDYYQSFSREPEELVDPNIYSDYAKLESLLRIKPNTAHLQVIADILSNREVICRLTTTYTINNNHDEENDFSLDDFISLLFYLGYLTISGSKGVRVYLKVPNEVIKNVYFDYFRAMLDNKDENAAKDIDAIDNILYEKDNTLFVKQVENVLDLLDKRDYMKFDEGRLKVACAAVSRGNPSVLFKSEYAVSGGFIDFVLFPYQVQSATALVELKYIKGKNFTEQLLQEKRKEALLELKKYEKAKEFQNIDLVKWILIFCKNECVLNELVE